MGRDIPFRRWLVPCRRNGRREFQGFPQLTDVPCRGTEIATLLATLVCGLSFSAYDCPMGK